MTQQKTPEHMTELAKQLRQNQTDAEKLIWHSLRNRQLANAKFRRQHPIEGYIADFYCHEHKLVIELDGGQHFTEDGIRKDAQRTARLNELGIQVLRFDNRQVLTQIEAVLQMIYDRLTSTHLPHPNPLPEREGVKSAHSETGTIQSQGEDCSSSPLPLGEDLGEGLLIKKNLMGLGYEC
jgi:type I restriction enzyme M protein